MSNSISECSLRPSSNGRKQPLFWARAFIPVPGILCFSRPTLESPALLVMPYLLPVHLLQHRQYQGMEVGISKRNERQKQKYKKEKNFWFSDPPCAGICHEQAVKAHPARVFPRRQLHSLIQQSETTVIRQVQDSELNDHSPWD